MKIQYASDLHLEFTPNFNLIKSISFEVVGDVLVHRYGFSGSACIEL